MYRWLLYTKICIKFQEIHEFPEADGWLPGALQDGGFHRHVEGGKWQAGPGRLRGVLEVGLASEGGQGLRSQPSCWAGERKLEWRQPGAWDPLGLTDLCPWKCPPTEGFRQGLGWAPWCAVKGCEVAPTLEITRLPSGSHIFHRLSRPLVERIVGDTKIGVSVHGRGPCYLSTSVRFGSQAVDPCNRCMTPFQWGQLFVPPSGTNLE